jgi:hypothetical protein
MGYTTVLGFVCLTFVRRRIGEASFFTVKKTGNVHTFIKLK